MDLVQEIKSVRFTLARNGYDCAAVDSYLAKLRDDLTAVQKEREVNSARIVELEKKLEDGEGAASETEGTLRRTLLLAQRLADETERDAKEAATDMVETATAEAKELRDTANAETSKQREEATAEANKLVADAEAEAAATRSLMESELAASQADKKALDATIVTEAEDARVHTSRPGEVHNTFAGGFVLEDRITVGRIVSTLAADDDERAVWRDRQVAQVAPAKAVVGLLEPWDRPPRERGDVATDIDLCDGPANFVVDPLTVVKREQVVTVW